MLKTLGQLSFVLTATPVAAEGGDRSHPFLSVCVVITILNFVYLMALFFILFLQNLISLNNILFCCYVFQIYINEITLNILLNILFLRFIVLFC